MVILGLTLKNFGKFNQKQIQLKEGINLIYGENEAGKSTIHTFIRGMLFGIEKQRGRASKNDAYSLYEPWENPAYFEGVLRFEEEGQIYKIERRFHRLTKEFLVINESEGRELIKEEFERLIPCLNESTYVNTVSVGQLKGATDGGLIGELNNYIANLNTTRHMELDVGKATTFLKKKKKENELKLHLEAEEKLLELEGEINLVEQEIEQIGLKKEELEEDQYTALYKDIKADTKDKLNKRSKLHLLSIFVILLLLIIEVAFIVLAQGNYLYLKQMLGVILFLCIGIFLWNFQNMRNHEKNLEKENQKREVENQELLKQIQKAEWKLEQLQENAVRLQERKEEWQAIVEENQKFQEEIKAIDLALETIQDIARNIKRGFGDMVNYQTSKFVEKFTNGKYSDLKVDESLNVKINDSEKLIPLEQVSKGTIEQIYLALRLAVADVMFGTNKMPVLLDDAFVLYDEERLSNTLKQFKNMDRQIIVFTCHKREKEILENLKISHSYIELT